MWKILLLSSLLLPVPLYAAGTIDPAHIYAWSERVGWINFYPTGGNVTVTDSTLSGYVWNSTTGWIHLSPLLGGVRNDARGNLSGSAWGEGVGYVDFSGVTIDTAGYFHGYATSDMTGRISFNCANTDSCADGDFKVRTLWTPTPPPSTLPSASASAAPSAVQLIPGPYATTTAFVHKFAAPVTATSKCPYFTAPYVSGGAGQEVVLLQAFLMYYGYMQFDVPTTIYGPTTIAAVKRFQQAYADQILKPWGLTTPTGRWYITTRKQANQMVECPTTGTLVVRAGESKNIRALPGRGADIVASAAAGATYKYYGQDNGWFYIDYTEGKSGWISGNVVTVTERSLLEQ